MPLDWTPYDGFAWDQARQAPLDDRQRRLLEEWAADVLALAAPEQARTWGSASPPGRYAATVVRVGAVEHRYRLEAQQRGIAAIGLKVFKDSADARREARGLIPFHRDLVHRLPGLPCAHVQRSLTAGTWPCQGGERAFVVQEWVVGASLEDLIRRRWPAAPLDGGRVRSLLQQLFGGLVIPLWAQGLVWWDVRDANFCYDEPAGRLTMIDSDSLAAFADEILDTPKVWQRREKGRQTALARLRQMTVRLVLAQGLRPRRRAEEGVAEAWRQELEPALAVLGRVPAGLQSAQKGLTRFEERLEQAGLLVPA